MIAQIGHGGMGRVWEAQDTRLGRTVAVKEVLLPALPPAQQEIRLQLAMREGRNAAAFADHPHVVSVYDVIEEDGAPWIVMQLVRGRSLRHVLRDPAGVGVAEDQDVSPTALDVSRVSRIAAAMLDALRAMHEAGLIHRDLKPHNIMLADDGQILLTDFGIAKSDSDVTVTVSGSVMGTMAYLAPERAEGEPGGPASDLFSLGVTLFEAVEGYSPFERRNSRTGTLTALLTKPLPPMVKAGPLAPLIQALTLKDPAHRPDHAQALALLAGGDADGRQPPAQDDRATAVLPPSGAPGGTPPIGSGQRMAAPGESVTLTASSGLPRPPVVATPQPAPDSGQPGKRNRMSAAANAFVVVVGIGLAAGGYFISGWFDSHPNGRACTTWSNGVREGQDAVQTHQQYSKDQDLASTEQAMAQQEDLLVTAGAGAAAQTSDKTLKADFQKSASDHSSLAAAYRAIAAGSRDYTAYTTYMGATSHDDIQIQAICAKA
ncbi:serine/threonine-protein kinase [Catenulispora sp. GP43]|uniref:serine/threonine-protein kinase n=1 Tax=Catenulispora sp. GP43 TaxID=3156263 RepID=UPI00351130A9